MPLKETKFNIELEMAIVIGKKGKDISKENADNHIFDYTILTIGPLRPFKDKK